MNLNYAAGIVDGEGCLRFGKSENAIYPIVLVVNTNKELLELFKEQWGGDICLLVHRKANWKTAYTWRISWNRAYKFTMEIYPYLRVKHRQARMFIAWDTVRNCSPKCSLDKDTRLFFLNQMRWYNKRGINNEVSPIEVILKEIGYACN